jgi:hypothetical protein
LFRDWITCSTIAIESPLLGAVVAVPKAHVDEDLRGSVMFCRLSPAFLDDYPCPTSFLGVEAFHLPLGTFPASSLACA